MFEQAARLKLRFDTAKGLLTAEDLWDLPLTGNGANLDKIARTLNKQLKESDEESFVVKSTRSYKILQLKFDLVKHVIDVRLAENTKAADARAKREQKQNLLALIDRKKNEKLEGASLEELTAMVTALDE